MTMNERAEHFARAEETLRNAEDAYRANRTPEARAGLRFARDARDEALAQLEAAESVK
jgi:hypothetical protein